MPTDATPFFAPAWLRGVLPPTTRLLDVTTFLYHYGGVNLLPTIFSLARQPPHTNNMNVGAAGTKAAANALSPPPNAAPILPYTRGAAALCCGSVFNAISPRCRGDATSNGCCTKRAYSCAASALICHSCAQTTLLYSRYLLSVTIPSHSTAVSHLATRRCALALVQLSLPACLAQRTGLAACLALFVSAGLTYIPGAAARYAYAMDNGDAHAV